MDLSAHQQETIDRLERKLSRVSEQWKLDQAKLEKSMQTIQDQARELASHDVKKERVELEKANLVEVKVTPERLEQIRRLLRYDNQGSHLISAIAELVNEVDRCWRVLKLADIAVRESEKETKS